MTMRKLLERAALAILRLGMNWRRYAIYLPWPLSRWFNRSYVLALPILDWLWLRLSPDSNLCWLYMSAGILFRPASFWIGAHWSPYNRRLCFNLLPCITVWIAWPGGKQP